MNISVLTGQIGPCAGPNACTHLLTGRVQMVRAWVWMRGGPSALLTHCGGTSSSIQHLMRTDWLFLPPLPFSILRPFSSPPPLSLILHFSSPLPISICLETKGHEPARAPGPCWWRRQEEYGPSRGLHFNTWTRLCTSPARTPFMLHTHLGMCTLHLQTHTSMREKRWGGGLQY